MSVSVRSDDELTGLFEAIKAPGGFERMRRAFDELAPWFDGYLEGLRSAAVEVARVKLGGLDAGQEERIQKMANWMHLQELVVGLASSENPSTARASDRGHSSTRTVGVRAGCYDPRMNGAGASYGDLLVTSLARARRRVRRGVRRGARVRAAPRDRAGAGRAPDGRRRARAARAAAVAVRRRGGGQDAARRDERDGAVGAVRARRERGAARVVEAADVRASWCRPAWGEAAQGPRRAASERARRRASAAKTGRRDAAEDA